MKKILNLIVVFLMAILLVACNKPSEDDPFKLNEKNVVELSSTEIIDLISNLDQEQVFNNIFKMTFEGSIKQEEFNVFENITDHFVHLAEGSGEIAVNLTDQVENAVVLVKASAKYEETSELGGVLNGAGKYDYADSYAEKAEGSMEAFLLNSFVYYKVQAENKEYEQGALKNSEIVSVKERLSQGINQEMYEVIKNPLTLIFGAIGSEPEMPEVNLDDFDDLLDKLPKIKAYKDGNKYTLLVEFNKQNILDKFEDAVYEFADAMEIDRPTKTEIDEVIEVIDEAIKELNFKFLITIENNKVLKVALDVKLSIYQEEERYNYFDGEYTYKSTITIDFKFVINTQSSSPTLPTDLDQYIVVDSPSIFD